MSGLAGGLSDRVASEEAWGQPAGLSLLVHFQSIGSSCLSPVPVISLEGRETTCPPSPPHPSFHSLQGPSTPREPASSPQPRPLLVNWEVGRVVASVPVRPAMGLSRGSPMLLPMSPPYIFWTVGTGDF